MYRKKSRFRLLGALLLVLLLTAGAAIGSLAAKYLYQQKLEATVTFTASLASNFQLLESNAVKDTDTGAYTLTEESVYVNTYELIPGLDIPKDPYVIVEGKTPLPAYLYVEVVDGNREVTATENGPQILDYTIRKNWTKIAVTGLYGGDVYCYTGSGTEPVTVDDSLKNEKIYILEGRDQYPNGMVTVSQHLLHSEISGSLKFYGYLYEAYTDKETSAVADAETVFNYHRPETQ